MRIEALVPVSGDVWEVRLSDGTCLRLLEASLAAAGLAVGDVLSEQAVADLYRQAGVDRALRDALRLLAVRARSAGELRQRLTRKGHSTGVVDQVMAILQRRGWIDDEAFAQQWARAVLSQRPSGPRRLLADLTRRGVDRQVAQRAVEAALAAAAAEGPGDGRAGEARADAEAVLAWRALSGRLGRGWSLDDPRHRRRALDFLLRRGFSLEAALDALRRAGAGDLGDQAADNFT